MNSPHLSSANRAELLEKLCRHHGVPVTIQRRAVMESVGTRTDHPTADQVYEAVKERLPGISRVTVYRVLDAFVSWGIVRRISNAEARGRFDGNLNRHHHIQCIRCGAIADVHDERLDSLPQPDLTETGFSITDYSVSFTGMCARCRGAVTGAH